MLYVMLANLLDPIVIALALLGGYFSRSWLPVLLLSVLIAVVGEAIVGHSFEIETLLMRVLAAFIWGFIGYAAGAGRRRKRANANGAPSVLSQLSLGNHLTKMTNWMEAIENTRLTMYAGAGGGIDSLPRDQQARAVKELEAGMAAVAKYPRHVITAELIKNRQVALQLGRRTRADAIGNLLENLISRDLALGAEDFLKSYA
jgi:hypothetical protein